MTFQQLLRYLEHNCPVTVDPVEEDLYLVTNIVTFQEAYLHVESSYEDSSLVHFFYEIEVSAPPHLREETFKYRTFRRGLARFKVPAVPPIPMEEGEEEDGE
jgi:hypothetical protein